MSMEHAVPPIPPAAWESAGFWEGVRSRTLVFQRCADCGRWVHPPRPACPGCRSFRKEWARSSGRGIVHSVTVCRSSPHPAFEAPYAVVLVELEEGVRMVSNIVGTPPEEIRIGMPVEVVFEEAGPDLVLPKFKKR